MPLRFRRYLHFAWTAEPHRVAGTLLACTEFHEGTGRDKRSAGAQALDPFGVSELAVYPHIGAVAARQPAHDAVEKTIRAGGWGQLETAIQQAIPQRHRGNVAVIEVHRVDLAQ